MFPKKTAMFTLGLIVLTASLKAQDYQVVETNERIFIETDCLKAQINKKGYVSGVFRESLIDKETGTHDLGFGLDIADWIMEPGSDESYREQLDPELVYRFGNKYHGKTPKRSIEGPQICTKAKELNPEVIRGKDYVAIKQSFQYKTAAPGKKTGSVWTQILLFPMGKRYFVSMDRIDAGEQQRADVSADRHARTHQAQHGRYVFTNLPQLPWNDPLEKLSRELRTG